MQHPIAFQPITSGDHSSTGQFGPRTFGAKQPRALCRFDLRFVPDSEDFSTRKVRDEAADVPAGYKPPDVKIAAMLHTKPRLTWDADDDDRKRTLSRRLTKEQLRDDDFKVCRPSNAPRIWRLCHHQTFTNFLKAFIYFSSPVLSSHLCGVLIC